MPYYERTGMISHRHPFYGEDDELLDMGPEVTVSAPPPSTKVTAATATTLTEVFKPNIFQTAIVAAEAVALYKIWQQPGAKSWHWYVLGGLVGMAVIGQVAAWTMGGGK